MKEHEDPMFRPLHVDGLGRAKQDRNAGSNGEDPAPLMHDRHLVETVRFLLKYAGAWKTLGAQEIRVHVLSRFDGQILGTDDATYIVKPKTRCRSAQKDDGPTRAPISKNIYVYNVTGNQIVNGHYVPVFPNRAPGEERPT